MDLVIQVMVLPHFCNEPADKVLKEALSEMKDPHTQQVLIKNGNFYGENINISLQKVD